MLKKYLLLYFKNNLGRKVTARGEEVYYYPDITRMVVENPDYNPNDKVYSGLDEYRLENAKIVKVY